MLIEDQIYMRAKLKDPTILLSAQALVCILGT
jgi:hypothetical protein